MFKLVRHYQIWTGELSLTVKSAAHDVDIGKQPDKKIKGTWGASQVVYDT